MIRVVTAATPVAFSVAVASRGEVIPGTGVAVIAVGVLPRRGREIPGLAGARVVTAGVAVPRRVALLPGARVGVPAWGQRLPARGARIAFSPTRGRGPPAHSTTAAASGARRRGPFGGRAGPARRRAALHGHWGPGRPQVEIPSITAIVSRPTPGGRAPRADATAAGPAQAPRATAATGRRQRAPPAALKRRLGGLGYFDGLTIQGLAVHVSDGGLGVGGAFEGDEREASGLAGFSIFHQQHLNDAAILAELGLEGFLVNFGTKPANEELSRAICFYHVGSRVACGGGRQRSSVGCGLRACSPRSALTGQAAR